MQKKKKKTALMFSMRSGNGAKIERCFIPA
jgi:hypothetical protein